MAFVVVVGGGLVGALHALEARRCGHDVTVLMRSTQPRSASVRGLGLLTVGGQRAGEQLDLALASMPIWRQLVDEVPLIGHTSAGCLTVAVTEMDWEAMSAAVESDDAARRGFTLLPSDALRARTISGNDVRGALWSRFDASLDPARTAPALLARLAARGVRIRRHVEVTSVEDGAVELLDAGTRHRLRADLVIVCPGTSEGWWPSGVGPVTRRTRFRMFETAPTPPTIATTIADTDTMRQHPGFDAVASLLGPRDPDAARWRARLRAVQRRDGRILFGDSCEPADIEVDRTQPDGRAERHLTDRLESILGTRLPAIERRWTYTHSARVDGAPFGVAQLAARTWLVSDVNELGLACVPMVARRLIDAAFEPGSVSGRPIGPATSPIVG